MLYLCEEFIRLNEIVVDLVEDVRWMVVCLWFGVGGKIVVMFGFRKNISWNGLYMVYEWMDMFNWIGYVVVRLKNV